LACRRAALSRAAAFIVSFIGATWRAIMAQWSMPLGSVTSQASANLICHHFVDVLRDSGPSWAKMVLPNLALPTFLHGLATGVSLALPPPSYSTLSDHSSSTSAPSLTADDIVPSFSSDESTGEGSEPTGDRLWPSASTRQENFLFANKTG